MVNDEFIINVFLVMRNVGFKVANIMRKRVNSCIRDVLKMKMERKKIQ